MTLEQGINLFLSSPFIKALLAMLTMAAAAQPVMRFWHDREELKLREREVKAYERIAAQLERGASFHESEASYRDDKSHAKVNVVDAAHKPQ